MYLTAGQYKGTKIDVPNGVKPTLSKVRQGVFNMLFSVCDYKTFLDMFAGSGLMSLEAYSRGYKVTSIEKNKSNIKIINSNFKKANCPYKPVNIDCLKFNTNEKFDIIYLDPPWEMDYCTIIKKAESLLNPDGVVVVEYDNQRNIDIDEILKENNSKLSVLKNKKYGRCLITLLHFG